MRPSDKLCARTNAAFGCLLLTSCSCCWQSAAISDEAFAQLLLDLAKPDKSGQLDYVMAAACSNYFMSDQGKQVLDLLATGFDKVGHGEDRIVEK